GRVLVFMLTGLDPPAVLYGTPREIGLRLAELTGLRDSVLVELLADTLADEGSGELDGVRLMRALASTVRNRTARRPHFTAPLFTSSTHESVLAEGLKGLTAAFRQRLDRLQVSGATYEATLIDVHAG